MRIGLLTILMLTAISATAQQTPPPTPEAPTLTLEEKIILTTDEIKKGDILEKANKAYLLAIKPIQEHEDAAKAAIEKDHPGYIVENGKTGWVLTKKPEPKPEAGKEDKK